MNLRVDTDFSAVQALRAGYARCRATEVRRLWETIWIELSVATTKTPWPSHSVTGFAVRRAAEPLRTPIPWA